MSKVTLEHLELQLKSALLGTGLVQPVESGLDRWRGGGEVEVLCRQVPGQEAPWMRVVDQVLALTEAAPMSLHLCRRYLRKNGRMVFGWHVAMSGKMSELKSVVEAVVSVLVEARPQLDAAAPARRARQAQPAPHQDDEEPEEAREDPNRFTPPHTPGQRPPPTAPVPRAPGPPANGVHPPAGFVPSIRVVKNEVDEEGNRHIEEIMPLPHVYHEMNKPTAGGRGASLHGTNPSSRRR